MCIRTWPQVLGTIQTEESFGSSQNDNPGDVVIAVTQFFQLMASGQFAAPRAPQALCTMEQFSL